ncbi:Chromatin assembly factor 1 subunit FAS2 [Hondaea fermentalgiana]|uniref:Chromatin assembly factor 1 subunit FAS2 n=1 Tax=Hondaea fermentalgiana TaxID=2315210 RepID=A0A2R5GL46_9STRA|nr:Chromatin assembly factor 1 subunit FAS2 [Hondaea fermentalgiana]|eukprot:GBG31626.1 Chromatin assembly factor 1 subunit FAS2 [Hondaea fermentalgiana]
MRVATPEIALHVDEHGKNGPVYAVDVHPKLAVMVTGGSDNEIKFWSFDETKEGESPFTFVCGFQAHHKSVNAARFSPNGALLATCSDDGTVCVLRPEEPRALMDVDEAPKTDPDDALVTVRPGATNAAEDGAGPATHGWERVRDEKDVKRKFLRGHTSDVSDLAWASDSRLLASGSVDGAVLVWDGRDGKLLQTFHEHGHFVQGVAWDPFRNFFATCSADRTVKVFKRRLAKSTRKKKAKLKAGTNENDTDQGEVKDAAAGSAGATDAKEFAPRFVCAHELSTRQFPEKSAPAPAPSSSPKADNAESSRDSTSKLRKRIMFEADTVPTMVRRLAWSPDGVLLLTPTGRIRAGQPTSFAFMRGGWQTPIMHFPGAGKASVAIRFSPVFYALRPGVKPWLNVPYRMVFAVVTLDSIFIYDTQHRYAIAAAEQLHFAELTDVSWSGDGRVLVVSSRDGYCSLISTAEGEIGTRLTGTKVPAVARPGFEPKVVSVDQILAQRLADAQAQQASEKTVDVKDPLGATAESKATAKTGVENAGAPKAPVSLVSSSGSDNDDGDNDDDDENDNGSKQGAEDAGEAAANKDTNEKRSSAEKAGDATAAPAPKKRRIVPIPIDSYFKKPSSSSSSPAAATTSSAASEGAGNNTPKASCTASVTKTLQRRRITPIQVKSVSPSPTASPASAQASDSIEKKKDSEDAKKPKKRRIAPTPVKT